MLQVALTLLLSWLVENFNAIETAPLSNVQCGYVEYALSLDVFSLATPVVGSTLRPPTIARGYEVRP